MTPLFELVNCVLWCRVLAGDPLSVIRSLLVSFVCVQICEFLQPVCLAMSGLHSSLNTAAVINQSLTVLTTVEPFAVVLR